MKVDVMMKQFELYILRLVLMKIYQNKGTNCYFTDCIKTKQKNLTLACIRMFTNGFDSSLALMIDIIVPYILILV